MALDWWWRTQLKKLGGALRPNDAIEEVELSDELATDYAAENDPQSSLPPFITLNPRQKMEADKISLRELLVKSSRKPTLKPNEHLVDGPIKEPLKPIPRHPLVLNVWPDHLHFELNEDIVIRKLKVWNNCPRSIYIHCCGLWDETARLGASWVCYPRTRFRLPSGFMAEIFIKATPKGHSLVPCAFSGLQVAAAHMRDHVIGHFLIPICVNFLRYIPPCMGENG